MPGPALSYLEAADEANGSRLLIKCSLLGCWSTSPPPIIPVLFIIFVTQEIEYDKQCCGAGPILNGSRARLQMKSFLHKLK